MPGFCGYVQGERHGSTQPEREIVDEMSRMIVHAGDQQAVRFATDGMAMAVLSRPDLLTPIPFSDEQAGLAVFFEGEISNSDEVEREVEKRGYRIEGPNPSELALRAYQSMGKNVGLLMNGAYNVFIWDRRRKALVIVNDRLGMRPLYSTRVENTVYFGSELKTFMVVPGFTPVLDEGFLYQFLRFGYPLGERTLFDNVSLMPMGSVLEIHRSGTSLDSYWGPEHWPRRRELSDSEAVEELSTILSRSVSRAMKGPGKKGLLLSGGIDSRVILAQLARECDSIPTFTFGEKGCDDIRIAQQVAGVLGFPNRSFFLDPDQLIDRSLEACWILDGMYSLFHVHGVSTYADIAREVPVVLTGMEQLALYYHDRDLAGGMVTPALPEDSEELFRYLYQEPSAVLADGSGGLLCDPFSSRAADEDDRAEELLHGGIVVGDSGGVDSVRTLEWLGLRHRQRRFTLQGHLLIRGWLEMRTPIMDAEVIAFGMTLPDRLRVEEKPMHIGLLSELAPELLGVRWQRTGRSIRHTGVSSRLTEKTDWIAQKARSGLARLSGTGGGGRKSKLVDYHGWMLNDGSFRNFVERLLTSPRTIGRGIFRETAVRRILEEEFSDTRIHTELIGRMITLELAMRLFFDGEESEGRGS